MKPRLATILACSLALMSARPLAAFDVNSLQLHLHLAALTSAEPPAIVEEHLVLSVQGDYRFVGAAFSFEDWRTVHAFERNRSGVWVLAIPLPYGDPMTCAYRLQLDGLWVSDPSNPERARDAATGALVSVLRFPGRPRTVLGVWDPVDGRTATFWFEGEPGQRVTVAGSFNGWDPFIHELQEVAPGKYRLDLELGPGEHYYVFMYRGERVPDPLNGRLLYGRDGRVVSAITVSAP